MQKINFENLPSESTPVNAGNLNQIQNNVENSMLRIGYKERVIPLTNHSVDFYNIDTSDFLGNVHALWVQGWTCTESNAYITTFAERHGGPPFQIYIHNDGPAQTIVIGLYYIYTLA